MRAGWGGLPWLAARAARADARCPPPCAGHGVCKMGFCKCDEGWFGHDCAYRMEGVAYTPGSVPGLRVAAEVVVVGRIAAAACQGPLRSPGKCARHAVHPERPPVPEQVTRRRTGPGSGARCARRRPRTRGPARGGCGRVSGCTSCPPTTTPCSCSTASPSTGRWAGIGAAAHLGGQARDICRPPRRHACRPPQPARHLCVSRLYRYGNDSYSVDTSVYQLEMALHEMMLQSPHRTLDPEVGRRGRRWLLGGPHLPMPGLRGARSPARASFAAPPTSLRSPTPPPICRKPTFSMCPSTPVA